MCYQINRCMIRICFYVFLMRMTHIVPKFWGRCDVMDSRVPLARGWLKCESMMMVEYLLIWSI